jgi:hypothetical protein
MPSGQVTDMSADDTSQLSTEVPVPSPEMAA